jgi:NADP-dependent 3-hydroxy acid dehydrogenase YdfG
MRGFLPFDVLANNSDGRTTANDMNKIIIVTGASSGFGLMARNAAQVEAVKAFAADNKADLRAILSPSHELSSGRI